MSANINEKKRILYVGNLNRSVTHDHLYELMIQAGPVERVTMVDGRTFAFVQFEDKESVDYAIQIFKNVKLFNRQLSLGRRGDPGPGYNTPEEGEIVDDLLCPDSQTPIRASTRPPLLPTPTPMPQIFPWFSHDHFDASTPAVVERPLVIDTNERSQENGEDSTPPSPGFEPLGTSSPLGYCFGVRPPQEYRIPMHGFQAQIYGRPMYSPPVPVIRLPIRMPFPPYPGPFNAAFQPIPNVRMHQRPRFGTPRPWIRPAHNGN